MSTDMSEVPCADTTETTEQYVPGRYERSDKVYESRHLGVDVRFMPDALHRLITMLPRGAVIAGGCLTDAYKDGTPPKDIDVFFTEVAAAPKFRAILKDFGFQESPLHTSGCENFERIHFPLVQLVNIRTYGSVEEIIDGFDFTVCQLAVSDGKLYCGPTTMQDIGERVININRLEENYPDVVEKRIKRYISKGYHPSPETVAALASLEKST